MISFTLNPITGNLDAISTVAIGATPNGLSITTDQVLSIALASTSTTGALSSTDWNTFNSKAPAGNYITALTGDVAATGPGSAAATIQPNVVDNTKLAQMPTLTIKGNNTGGTANALDLTPAQVNAIMPVFTADSYASAGVQGLVPAPPASSTINGKFLAPNGLWKYVDQSKPLYSSFSKVIQVPSINASNTKFQDVTLYSDPAGNQYALCSGNAAATMAIYNINNQAAPVLMSTTGLQGTFRTQVIYPYAYIPSSGGSTFYIYDISNPTAPTPVGSVGITGGAGALYNCVVQGNYAYISTQSKGLTVVDITTPSAPVQVYQEGGTLNKSFGIALGGGNILYTTNYQTTSPWTVRYLKTWDISTPTAPSLTNTYTLPANTKPNQMTISGNYGYLTDTNQQVIQIIDLTTPTAPNYLASMAPSYLFGGGFTAQISGNYAYIPSGQDTTNGGAIDVYNISNKSAPYKIATTYSNQATSPFGGIQIKNNYIYVGDYGIAPGSTSYLDIFTTIAENIIEGNAVIDTLAVKKGATNGYVLTSDASGNATWQAATGGASAYKVDTYTLSGTDITNKYVTLTTTPSAPTKTVLDVSGGPIQDYGTDYTITGTQLGWSGLFLDGVLVAGDKLIVQYL